jgi:hypothetical protein
MHESPYESTPGIGLMQKRGLLRTCFLWLSLGCAGAFTPLNVGPLLYAQDAKDAQGQQAQKDQEPSASEPDQPDVASQQPLDLTEQVIRDVLEPLQAGMQGHSLRQVLTTWDRENMLGYAQQRDQLAAFFRQYDEVRFRYKVLQVTSDKDRGFAMAEVDMEAQSFVTNQVPLQRSIQMRFQLKLEPKGWKIVGFQPSNFFAQ